MQAPEKKNNEGPQSIKPPTQSKNKVEDDSFNCFS